MNNISPFAEHLKSLIQERGLTHREVADAAGVTKNAVGKWLKSTIPGARELFRLARFFGKPMESFFEGIPYAEPSTPDPLDTDPGGVPVKFLTAKWREFYTGMFEMMSTPEGREASRAIFARLAEALQRPQKKMLPCVTVTGNITDVKSQMPGLLAALRKATIKRGMKTTLAKAMGVPLSNVSQWLSGDRKPGGERALQLLHWVEQQEAKPQQESPGGAQTPPGPKTQSKASNEKKPKSSQQKQ